jgi:competence protein ComEC
VQSLREPLVFPVLALCLGIVLVHQWGGDRWPLVISIASCAALAVVSLVRGLKSTAGIASLTGFVFCGGLLEISHAPGNPPKLDVPDLSVTIISGCVVQPPALTGDREQFVMELAPHAKARVTMFAHPGEELPSLRYGEMVEVEGKVRTPRNFGNPDAFDYRNFLARQDVYWTLSTIVLKPLPGRCGNWFDAAVTRMRTALLDRIGDLYPGDHYDRAMMNAVLVGETSSMDRIWTEEYRSTGTFHTLVISGAHVAVLAACFLSLLRICFIPHRVATLLTVLAAWMYAFLTGCGAPVVRCASGMTLFAVGALCFRERRLLNLLAGVALLFILVDPDQVFEASFQLSFLAVAFLALFAVPIMDKTSQILAAAVKDLADTGRDPHLDPAVAALRIELRLYAETISWVLRIPMNISRAIVCVASRFGAFVFDLVVISAMVQAALALPMVIYFHRFSFTGISANVFVVPLLCIVVPLGFLAVFTNFHWLAAMAAILLDWSRHVVAWHAHLEPNWRIPAPPVALSIAIAIALALAAVRWQGQGMRWISMSFLTALFIVLIVFPFGPRLSPGNLEMTLIDVGQGDSIFLSFPNGKTMLMDAGGVPSFGHKENPDRPPVKMEIGEDVVAPYLWTRQMQRIDVVAISHLHDDHVGGMPAILNDFAVRELWVGVTEDGETWRRIQAIARARGTVIRRFARGAEMPFGGAWISVLAPSTDYVPGAEPANNDSLVLRIQYGDRSFLLTGDMEKPVEHAVAASDGWPHADVLKVGHHGSKTSSTPEFLDQVHPALAAMSDGYGNLYGHPHPMTLASLRERHILSFRTDLDGAITFVTDGKRVWRE